MFDSITMVLSGSCVSEAKLTDVSYHSYCASNYTTTVGYLENMRITLRHDATWIRGSLARYHFGHNVNTLQQAEVPQAVQRLSDSLSVDVSVAFIKRIDVGATLLMRHDPASYLQILEDYPRTKRVVHAGETVSFINSGRGVIFYDKFKELQSVHRRTVQTPVERQARERLLQSLPRNLLRCECQFKSLKRMFPSGLKVSQLADDTVYVRLIAEWRQTCLNVTKSHGTVSRPVRKAKDMILNLASTGLQTIGGLSRALEIVSKAGGLSAMQKSRVRKQLRALALMNDNRQNDLANELDDAIRAVSATVVIGSPELPLFRIGSVDRAFQMQNLET